MIETKYLIMIGIVVCVLVLYYFYDEIANTKKIMIPTYQKTMFLEAKIVELEQKTATLMLGQKNLAVKSSRKKLVDSPALSITYQSDMINRNNNNNLSVMYADLTETEANQIRQKIELLKKRPAEEKPRKQFSPLGNKTSSSPKNSIPVEKSDTDIFDFMSQSQSQSNPSNLSNLSNLSNPSYQNILDNLSGDTNGIANELSESFSSMFDSEVAKCISDSINCVDLDQTNMSEISEIPVDSDMLVDQNKKINKTLSRKKINKKHNLK